MELRLGPALRRTNECCRDCVSFGTELSCQKAEELKSRIKDAKSEWGWELQINKER